MEWSPNAASNGAQPHFRCIRSPVGGDPTVFACEAVSGKARNVNQTRAQTHQLTFRPSSTSLTVPPGSPLSLTSAYNPASPPLNLSNLHVYTRTKGQFKRSPKCISLAEAGIPLENPHRYAGTMQTAEKGPSENPPADRRQCSPLVFTWFYFLLGIQGPL